MADYYDRDGNPLTLMEWSRKFEDPSYQRVARETVGDYDVSTVWLGADHGHGDELQIFETIVFGYDDEWIERYATLEEAESGHAGIVEKLRQEVGCA
jgi:hypothetical protein